VWQRVCRFEKFLTGILSKQVCHFQGRFDFGITWKGRGITYQAKQFVTGCLQRDPYKRWTAKEALANLHENWAPTVDKIWDDWQAAIKKKMKPEFVRPEDLEDLNDESDIEGDAGDDDSSQGSCMSGSSLLDEYDDEDPPPVQVDKHARAKYIKQHVQKVVKLKNAEGPIDTDEDVKWKLEEVQRYASFGIMKKTILITMANTLDRSDVGKLREIFLEADTNGSGTITLEELIDAFRKTSPEVDEKQVEALFKGIDRDKSGHIHYAEFLAALAESHGLVTMDRLTEVFDRIDTEGKGYITHEDLKSILGSDYDKQTVDKMIKEADVNNNGRVDYDELLQLMFSDPVHGDKLAASFDALASISSHDAPPAEEAPM
jgi:Ca2+-binding EF-hand superfamily protein